MQHNDREVLPRDRGRAASSFRGCVISHSTPQAQYLHPPVEGHFGGSPVGVTSSGTVGHISVTFLGCTSQQWSGWCGHGLLCVRTVSIPTLRLQHHCHGDTHLTRPFGLGPGAAPNALGPRKSAELCRADPELQLPLTERQCQGYPMPPPSGLPSWSPQQPVPHGVPLGSKTKSHRSSKWSLEQMNTLNFSQEKR